MAKRVASRGSEQFMLRLPDGMRDRIRAEADANGRSMNAEIVERLEQSFRSERSPSSLDVIAEQIVKQIASSETHLPQGVRDRFFETYERLKKQEMNGIREMLRAASSVRADLGIITPESDADI